MADKILKKMLKHTEIGATKKISAKKGKNGSAMSKHIKAKKSRFSTAHL